MVTILQEKYKTAIGPAIASKGIRFNKTHGNMKTALKLAAIVLLTVSVVLLIVDRKRFALIFAYASIAVNGISELAPE